MEFQQVIRARHSVRYFESRPVPEDVLEAIVNDAAQAPSWVNAQEWHVRIATGETLEKIRKIYAGKDRAGIKGTPDFPAAHRETWSEGAQKRMAAFSKSREDAGLAEVKLESQAELFHAPAVAYLTLPRTHSLWAVLDMGGFEQTLMLAAADRGVGSVPAYNLVKYPEVLREILGVPEDEIFAIGVALGYEADHPLNRFRSVKMKPEEFLTVYR